MPLIMTCLLLMACISGTGKNLNEASESSYAGPTSTTTSWGVSYDWSELPADIKDMTGLDIDQLLVDIEDAALDGNINLDLEYGIEGYTHYYVTQGPGQSTEIELSNGDDIDVDTIDTTITLRMLVQTTQGMDFDWSDDDVGFDVDLDTNGNNVFVVDVLMSEYYTDDLHFAGMDLSVTGSISLNSGATLDADFYAGNDRISFDNTQASMSVDFTIAELTAEWRMAEPSTIYEDIIGGDYDAIHWNCDGDRDDAWRNTWTESLGYDVKYTGYYSDNGSTIESDHYYSNYDSGTWYIFDNSAESLRLYWGEFRTESYYDRVEIYDDNTGQLLDTFSGYNSYEYTNWYDTNSIRIEWSADSSETDWGFEVNYWQSGISTGEEEHLGIYDACGEIDYTWDIGLGYDISMSNFPASQLGFTADQASLSLSDSISESGSENGERIEFDHSVYIVDDDYEITTADGTTKEVVKVEDGGPMLEAIGGTIGYGLALAMEDTDFEDIEDDMEDVAEEWEDDFDEDDADDVEDVAEDFENTDIEDDMEEMAEELEEVMEDTADSLESKYTDARMYWLIDKDTGHQISPQLLVQEAGDDDWVQMMGPDQDEFETPAETDDIDFDYYEGEEAVEQQEEVEDLTGDSLFAPKSDDDGDLMMYLMTGGIVVVVILLLGVMGMMLMRRGNNRDYDMNERNVNAAFNQSAFDMPVAGMGAGMNMAPPTGPPMGAPSAGPPVTMRGEIKDGFEWTEYPPNSGSWFYRDQVTNQWVKH
jgi:hypothetical protein